MIPFGVAEVQTNGKKTVTPSITDTAELERLYEAFFEDPRLPYCDTEAARAFIADLAQASPPDQRALIEQGVLPALGSGLPHSAQVDLLGKMAEAAGEAGMTAVFERYDERVLDRALAPFIETVNAKPEGLRTILFVATTPYFVILREAMYLRQHGHRVFLLSVSPLPENLQSMFEAHFDGLIDTRNCFRLVRAMLRRLRPDVVHVQCWMWMYILGRMAIEACPDIPVVCEFYDATSLFAEREDMLDKWKPQLIDLDLALEHFILHKADAIVSRYTPPVAEAWAEFHNASPRYLEFQPYPVAEFSHYADEKPSTKDGVIRLVHAGSFTPPDDEHPVTVYPERSTPDTFRSLLEQGFAVDVFCPPHIDPANLGPQFECYRQLEQDFDTFRFLKGVAPDKFSEVIAGYDFGILLFDYDPETARLGSVWMKGVMPTRFFSYLEAGIPGIVIAEYEDMTRFLEDNGFGVGIPSKDIPRMAEILADFDHAAAAANIRRYNAEHGMDKEIGRLIQFYDEITP